MRGVARYWRALARHRPRGEPVCTIVAKPPLTSWSTIHYSNTKMSDDSPSSLKIYTKTGDKGKSSLYSGERRPKTDVVFQALGDVDELNSLVGVARQFTVIPEGGSEVDFPLAQQLEIIQSRLLDVGSAVATPIESSSERKLQRVAFDGSCTADLETWIDEMTSQLPPLTNFILPSGGKAASFLHQARAVCRRAERSVVPLADSESTDRAVAIYLNRLSDYLFTAARFAAFTEGQPETVYRKGTAPKSVAGN